MVKSPWVLNWVEGRNVSIWAGDIEIIGDQGNNLETGEDRSQIEEKMDDEDVEREQM